VPCLALLSKSCCCHDAVINSQTLHLLHLQVARYKRCAGRSSPAGLNAPDPELCCTPGTRCRFYNPWYWRCKAPGDVAEPEAPPSWSDVACTGRNRVSPLAAWLHQYDCMRLVAILLLCHVAPAAPAAHCCLPTTTTIDDCISTREAPHPPRSLATMRAGGLLGQLRRRSELRPERQRPLPVLPLRLLLPVLHGALLAVHASGAGGEQQAAGHMGAHGRRPAKAPSECPHVVLGLLAVLCSGKCCVAWQEVVRRYQGERVEGEGSGAASAPGSLQFGAVVAWQCACCLAAEAAAQRKAAVLQQR
jgi:hypothetical protein